jgi:hypothetical protein
MTLKTLRCDADTVRAVAEWAKEHGDLSVGDAATILLASALGRQRAGQLNRTERDSAKGHGGNGHGDNDEEENGDAHEAPPVPPPQPPEPPPLQTIDTQAQADELADLVGHLLWGCTASEQRIVAAFPEWVHAAPTTELRPRFLALVQELERLKVDRFGPVAEAFLSARCGGLPLQDVATVMESQGHLKR